MEVNKKKTVGGFRQSVLQFNDEIEDIMLSPIPLDIGDGPSSKSPNDRLSTGRRRSSIGGKKIAEMYKTVLQMANENVFFPSL